MITLINPWTGTETRVADKRKDDYLAAGFKLAADAQKPMEEVKKPVKKTVKRATKSTTKKK